MMMDFLSAVPNWIWLAIGVVLGTIACRVVYLVAKGFGNAVANEEIESTKQGVPEPVKPETTTPAIPPGEPLIRDHRTGKFVKVRIEGVGPGVYFVRQKHGGGGTFSGLADRVSFRVAP